MSKLIINFFLIFLTSGCFVSSKDFYDTVEYVDMNKFMKKWYVIAGRMTSFEEGAHNAVEDYSWNEKEQRIDVDFYYNKDAFDGEIKKIPQKAWIYDKKTNAHWKVRPFWPLKLSYLIIDVADDYSWTAVGVPSQKFAWIMAENWQMDDETLNMILNRLKAKGYSIENINRVPQQW